MSLFTGTLKNVNENATVSVGMICKLKSEGKC
jgi:hypothetical protein